MNEYMYLFRGGDYKELQLSPEKMQAHMQKWIAWMKGLAEKGKFVAGQPLDDGGKVVEQAGKVITDGPFTEGKEIVGGYLIVKAGDLNEAVELSKACPIFEQGGTVEVRLIKSMEM
jgi:hypothetical protein